jgi:hypothetical protein
MILSAFFFNPQGDHRVSWRHPRASKHEVYDIAYFQKLAAAAKLDALFVADHVGMWDTFESNVAHYANPRLEPITLLSALASVTFNIGLLATASASYTEPYNLARMFASLDHLSRGRAGWNVVTPSAAEEATNFACSVPSGYLMAPVCRSPRSPCAPASAACAGSILSSPESIVARRARSVAVWHTIHKATCRAFRALWR